MECAPDPPSAFTFKRCLRLCLPALLCGLILRAALIHDIPEANYGSDGGSWASSAVALWTKHKHKHLLRFDPKRRWFYEVFLCVTPIFPGSLPRVVAVSQHALGLVMILGVGWIVGHTTRHRIVTVPLATLAVAVLPSLLFYEHDVSGDFMLPAFFVCTVALVFPLERLPERRRLLLFLSMAALMVSVKPHAKPIWLGLIALVVFRLGLRYRWRWEHLAVLAFSILVMETMGEKQMRQWLLLTSTLPLIQTEGEQWKEYREALRPAIEEARRDLANYPYRMGQFKHIVDADDDEHLLGEKWLALRKSPDFNAASQHLAFEAIRTHPLEFAKLTARKYLIAGSQPAAFGAFNVNRFWDGQIEAQREDWVESPIKMQFLYGKDWPAFSTMVEQRRQQPFRFEKLMDQLSLKMLWFRRIPISGSPFPSLHLSWLGVLASAGFLLALVSGRAALVILIVLPAALHNASVFAIGDSLPRYTLPVDWIGWVLIALGLDCALHWSLAARSALTCHSTPA